MSDHLPCPRCGGFYAPGETLAAGIRLGGHIVGGPTCRALPKPKHYEPGLPPALRHIAPGDLEREASVVRAGLERARTERGVDSWLDAMSADRRPVEPRP